MKMTLLTIKNPFSIFIQLLGKNLPIHNIGIKKVSRPTSKAGKSAVYAASRLSVYYSNSSPDGVNWAVFPIFYGIYYPYSLKNAVVFVAVGIFRAKIEPHNLYILLLTISA